MTDEERSGKPKDPYSYKREPSPLAGAGKYMGLGLQFAGSIVFFMFAGIWLDKRFGTSPIFVILGVFGGATAAFYVIYKKLMADLPKDERQQK